jgi:hypothetical protein
VTATEKVLQRKDGSTLIVGVVMAFAFLQFITTATMPLASKIMGQDVGQGYQSLSFQDQYLTPLVALVLQLIAIELFIWLVVGVRAFANPKTSKKKK